MNVQVLGYAFGAALIFLALAWRPWRGGEASRFAPVATALGFSSALVAVHVGQVGELPFPPGQSGDWLSLFVLAATLLAFFEGEGRAGRIELWIGRTLLAAAFLWFGLQAKRVNSWEGMERAWWLGGLMAGWLVSFGLCADLAERRSRGTGLPFVLWIVTAAAAVSLGLSGSVMLAERAGALAIVLGGVIVLSLWRERVTLAGATGALVAGLMGLLLIGHLYASLPWVAALILALAPQVARLPGMGSRADGVRALLAVVLGAVAVFLSLPEADPYDN